jgi:hypothetical protein
MFKVLTVRLFVILSRYFHLTGLKEEFRQILSVAVKLLLLFEIHLCAKQPSEVIQVQK